MTNASTDILMITMPNSTSWLEHDNSTIGVTAPAPKWGLLSLIIFIISTAVGNILVCLAVCWERRLQNMTNFFLMSLSIADLLVAVLVMPLGLMVEIYNGEFPLGSQLCTMWATFDVGLCTASIWHMCIMSMDRFFTLKYPMKYGRNKTKRMVLFKITIVWIISIAICSPVCVLGFVQPSSIYNDGKCIPTVKHFIIVGSVLAFYIPLLIMVITYVLTTNILRNNGKLMRSMEQCRQQSLVMRKHVGSGPTAKAVEKYLSPNGYSVYEEISNESALHSVSKCLTSDNSRGSLSETNDFYQIRRSNSNMIEINDLLQNVVKAPPKTVVVDADQTNVEPATHYSPYTNQRANCRLDSIVSEHSKLSTTSNSVSYLSIPFEHKLKLSTSIESLVSIHGTGILNEPPEVQERLSNIEVEMEEYLSEETPKVSESGQSAKENSDELDDKIDVDPKDPEDEKEDDNDSDASASHGSTSPVCPACEAFSTDDDNKSQKSSSNSEVIELAIPTKDLYIYQMDGQSDWYSTTRKITNTNQIRAVSYSKIPTSDPDETNCHRNLQKSKSFTNGLPAANNGQLPPNNDTSNNAGLTYVEQCRRESDMIRDNKLLSVRRAKNMVLRKTARIPHKRAANNEKKASKVLGIIFGVFVTLWTPFFIVNILTAICETCVSDISGELMSAFLWFGWIASLANPIIYTAFNTTFRRAFVKILTCKYKIQRRRSSTPESILLNTPTNWISSQTRRDTVTVNIN